MDSTNMSFDQTKTLFIQIESIREQSRIMAQSNTIHAATECEPFHERVQAVFQRRGGGSTASRRGQKRRLGGAAFRPPGVVPTTVRLLQEVPWWRESSSMSVAAMSVSLNKRFR